MDEPAPQDVKLVAIGLSMAVTGYQGYRDVRPNAPFGVDSPI